MHTAQQGLGPHKNHSETLGTAPSHSKGHADGCRCFVGKTKQGKPSSTQARTHTMSTPIPSFIHGNPGLMHFLKKKGTGEKIRTKKRKGTATGKKEIEHHVNSYPVTYADSYLLTDSILLFAHNTQDKPGWVAK